MAPFRQEVKEASGVFVGTVGPLLDGKTFTWEVRVGRVYKGDPVHTSTVNTGHEYDNGMVDTCSSTLDPGRRYLFLVEGRADTWSVPGCQDTYALPDAALSRVRQLMGRPNAQPPSEPEPVATDVHPAAESAAPVWWWMAGGAALIVTGTGSAVILVRRKGLSEGGRTLDT
jgi:hypothetical protein